MSDKAQLAKTKHTNLTQQAHDAVCASMVAREALESFVERLPERPPTDKESWKAFGFDLFTFLNRIRREQEAAAAELKEIERLIKESP